MPVDFAAEICRTLKPEGFFVVHTGSKDTYGYNAFLDLFNCCKLVKFKDIDGFDSHLPSIREIVMQQYASKNVEEIFGHGVEKPGGNSVNKCSIPGYKQELIRKAELLITEEPKKPWITLKKNIQNIKYFMFNKF